MSESKKFAFPCIGLAKEGDYHTVAIRLDHDYFTLTPSLAKSLATDLLIWADRVEKLNGGEKDE